MKKIFFLSLITLIAACSKKDFLERTPSDFIAEAEVFGNIENAEKFVNNAYSQLPNLFKPGGDNNWALSSGTDETEQIWDNGLDANYFNTAGWNPSIFPLSQYWGNYFASIRKINIFLKNYDIIPEDKQDTNRKKRMSGEMHALRAYYYFELYKMWGAVPIIDATLSPNDIEGSLMKRNPENEVINFIKKDLNIAIPLLPARHVDAQFGRMTSIACKFLLARTLLYHASALHNPTNESDRWVQAANAAKDALDDAILNNHQLCTTALNNKKAYERIFLELNNAEAIFTRTGVDFQWDQVTQPNGYGGWSGTSPTQEMVDAYEMVTGVPITDPSSGYDPQNPYVKRDPRFYQTILTNGQVWKGRAVNVVGNGPDSKTDHPPTNYFIRKFMVEEINIFNQTNKKYRPWILMRLGELYLIFAESKNEAVGPDVSVYNAVNLIRARAGMPPLPSGLTKEQMRERIRHERRIELALEEHRFWDVRRWKIAEIVDNRSIHYVSISAAGVFTYPERESRTFFAPKHYLFPIPQGEIDKNPKLTQNPGWQ